MTDASTRARLETMQVATRRLKEQLAERPTISAERRQLKDRTLALEGELATLCRSLSDARAREITLRDELDGTHKRTAVFEQWWNSPLTPFAAVLGGVLAMLAAGRMLDAFNWSHWAPIVGPWLAGFPAAVNLLRWGWARSRQRRRRDRQPSFGARR